MGQRQRHRREPQDVHAASRAAAALSHGSARSHASSAAFTRPAIRRNADAAESMAGTRGVDAKLAGRKSGGGQAEAGRGEDPAGELSIGTAPDRAVHAARVVVGWCTSDHGAHDIRRLGRFQSGKPQSRLATAVRWTIASGAATGSAAVSAPAEAGVTSH